MGLRMQLRNERFFTLFGKADSNVVESAAILMESVAAPHERWAELAKRMHDTEHASDDPQKRCRSPATKNGTTGPEVPSAATPPGIQQAAGAHRTLPIPWSPRCPGGNVERDGTPARCADRSAA